MLDSLQLFAGILAIVVAMSILTVGSMTFVLGVVQKVYDVDTHVKGIDPSQNTEKRVVRIFKIQGAEVEDLRDDVENFPKIALYVYMICVGVFVAFASLYLFTTSGLALEIFGVPAVGQLLPEFMRPWLGVLDFLFAIVAAVIGYSLLVVYFVIRILRKLKSAICNEENIHVAAAHADN
ncbi:MAG: hypothetical protein AAGJ28_06265 [Pseudomonadota bacterium]